MATLAEGKHTLKIAYQGGEVETEFTIVRSNPETLDSSLDVVAPFTICVLSSIAIAGYTLATKRSHRKNKYIANKHIKITPDIRGYF